MKKLFLALIIIGAVSYGSYWALSSKSTEETPVSYSLKKEYLEKVKKRKAGYAKMDAPGQHQILERKRRTPADRENPEYRPNHLVEEHSKLKKSRPVSNARVASSELDFIERGPGNVAGRTRGLIVDPDDASNQTWFAGSASGGIWKTTDSGQSWTLISQDIPNLGTNTLAMSPANTSVIYAGTGEHFTDAIDGSGLFKSTDKGQSWTQIASPEDFSDFKNISRIIVDPNDENVVLATTQTSVWSGDFRSSIYKSTDGGSSWDRVYTSDIYRLDDLDFEPGNFNTMYAAQQFKGVIKSTDGGENWEETGPGMKPTGRVEITVSPVNTDYIWASVQGQESGTGSDLYLSKDAGTTWSLVLEEEGNNVHFLGGQGWYDNIVTAHPYDENIVYVGGVNTFKFTLGSGTSAIEAIDVDPGDTDTFISLINFGAEFYSGTLALGDVPFDELVDVEVRFGVGSQKAHRFTVDQRGSGVPDSDYEYRDYVEVPFQVWDTENNQQLMVSFRDQQEDGEWNLLNQNTEAGDEANHSREYLFIHSIPYDASNPDPTISTQGGHAKNQQYFFWPYLTDGANFDKNNLPQSTFTIDKLFVEGLEKTVGIVSDAYNQFNANNNFSSSDILNQTGLHPDQHNILIIDNDNDGTFRLLIANDGGVYLSEETSDPALTDNTFIYSGVGYNSTQFYGADKAPGANRYIGGMQDNSTWYTPKDEDASASTNYVFAFGGDGFEAVWNNRDPDMIIGSSQFNGFARTLDGGETWLSATNGIDDNGPFYSRIARSKSNPDKLFAIGSSGVWVSEDFGGNWSGTPISDMWSFNNRADITVSQADPDVIWTGGYLESNRRIFVSTDGGDSFSPANNYSGTTLGFTSGLGTHPTDPNTGYALFSFAGRPKVLKTTDLGQSWEDISGFEGNNGESDRGFPDIAVNCILVFPKNPDRIWVGSELGIIESLDGGESWGALDSNFPVVNVYDMVIQDDQVVIATYGRGIWSVTIPDVAEEFIFAPTIEEVATAPNGGATFNFTYTNNFDSAKVFIDDTEVLKLNDISAGELKESINELSVFGSVTIRVDSYIDGELYVSDEFEAELFEVGAASKEYFADFTNSGSETDFFGSGFSVSNIVGFDSEALHSSHPYPVGSNEFYLLKTPIIVNEENPLLSYRDVAIVETGEDGAVYGEDLFYDYVVVEASMNGLDWTAIEGGYDASFDEEWTRIFSTGIEGYEDVMVSHEINLTDFYNEGDTIFVRYRLFSDGSLNAWGWAIDDINIQSEPLETDEVLDLNDQKVKVSVFPNPAMDHITDDYDLTDDGSAYLLTMNGKLFREIPLDTEQGNVRIDREGLPDGIYILQIRSETKNINRKIIFR